ncbi:MAG: helicase-related protein [Anaerolineae bacterium]
MSQLDELRPGARLYDRRLGRERQLYQVEPHGPVVFLSFLNPRTGSVERAPFPLDELEARFEVLDAQTMAFRSDAEKVRLVAEAYRLQHACLFNRVFATETALIDLLPHQLAAVYGVAAQPGMLDHPRLRFLLADDAGAGKTIMAGLYLREMLLRRRVERVMVVAPAGLVNNWERELRHLFGLRFRIISGGDLADGYNPFTDPQNALVIVKIDTLARERMRAAVEAAPPYDLVIFDEAHKLSARRAGDLSDDKSLRYQAAERIAWQGRHLLLMTATPHMGYDEPYYYLWRLLEPELFSTPEALARLPRAQRLRYLIRRMKEEMVRFDGTALFPPRTSDTVKYPLSAPEKALYAAVTAYCDAYFGRAQLTNRAAAKLAMSVLQRRLASSTLAILRSLENREAKLAQQLRDLESGLLSREDWEARQRALPDRDLRAEKTADEEESIDGREEAEQQDAELDGATAARTLEELRAEIGEVRRLVPQARAVYNLRRESKFERLWEALEAYPDTKVLIFTEFRDTLEFLTGRLEGKGLTGKLACIHGGMDRDERDAQVAFFRDPDGARIMVATDAAGEGINLQFCWLLVNYDIPWNPARLEQRMGRVHRYKQTHNVLLLNLVSPDTREGRVLQVLMDKLERIRQELASDKVFDIIGEQFTGRSLKDLIEQAVVEGREQDAIDEIERTLTREQIARHEQLKRGKVEVSSVRAQLDALERAREAANMRRMMPAYVRRFFERAAPLVGVEIAGDIEGVFALRRCPPGVARALDAYSPALREKLTFDRELAAPDAVGAEPKAIYLFPGEPVFEAVVDLFLGQYQPEADRGAVFLDGAATEPYLFYLGKVTLLRAPEADGGAPEVVEAQMTGVRRYADERMEPAPAHLLMTLLTPDAPPGDLPAGLAAQAADRAPVEAFLAEQLGLPALKARRDEEEARLPEQRTNLRAAYNLRAAELMRQRRLLQERVERGVPAAATKLRECEEELESLDRRRRESEARLLSAPQRLTLGPVNLYAQALVLPVPPEEVERRIDARAEEVALRLVRQREEAEGSVIEDVSNPQLKMGFDLKVTRADGSIRYVEVKGRGGRIAVELTPNEREAALNHRDRYWLYAVYDCDTVPDLHRVQDPIKKLVMRETGAVRINYSDVVAASRRQSQERA